MKTTTYRGILIEERNGQFDIVWIVKFGLPSMVEAVKAIDAYFDKARGYRL